MRIESPAAAARSATRCGNASSGSSPSPAVSLAATDSTVGTPGDAAVLGGSDWRAAADPPAAPGAAPAGRGPARAELSAVAALPPPPPAAPATHATPSAPYHAILARALMLVARQLTKEFRSGSHQLAVLRDVSFSVPDGA